MIILTIRTDKPEAEIGIYKDKEKLSYEIWPAHRQLAETIHLKIRDLLKEQKLSLEQLEGIACFKGPGSFTGLRIGLTVGNALAFSLKIPIVSNEGKDWQVEAIKRLLKGENETVALPEYGSDVHITTPKK